LGRLSAGFLTPLSSWTFSRSSRWQVSESAGGLPFVYHAAEYAGTSADGKRGGNRNVIARLLESQPAAFHSAPLVSIKRHARSARAQRCAAGFGLNRCPQEFLRRFL